MDTKLWYKAARYKDMEEARSQWRQIKNALRGVNLNLTPVSLIISGVACVVVVVDKVPSVSVQASITRGLARGQDMTVSDDVIQSIWKRRTVRQADKNPVESGYNYEGHGFNPVPHASGEVHDKETIDNHMRVVIEELARQGYPFMAMYALYSGYRLGQMLVMTESLDVITVKDETKKAIETADRYMFTESARAMHKAVHTGSSDFISSIGPSVWIEQDEAQPFTSQAVNLKAVHIFTYDDPTHGPTWAINVIGDTTEHIISLDYHDRNKTYAPNIYYMCPYQSCEDIQRKNYVYRIACPQCNEDAQVWGAWLHTAVEMIQKKYAVSATPAPFKTRTLTYKEKREVPRHHGKGAPKEKEFTVDVPYTLVDYDVSVTTPSLQEKESVASEEKRENWLTLSSPDDRIYKQMYIPASERHYRGAHFEALKKRCLQEGVVTEDGKIYRIEIDQDTGETVIVGKIITYPKYVPMLRPELKKPVIKKVTAQRFK